MATSIGNGRYKFDRMVTVTLPSGEKKQERMVKTFTASSANRAAIIEENMITDKQKELRGEKQVINGIPPLEQFIEEWKAWAAPTYEGRDATWASYLDRFKALLKFEPLRKAPIDKIDEQLLDRYESFRRKDGVSNSTLNRDFAALRLLLRRAGRWHKIRVPEFPHHKEKKHNRVVTPAEEVAYSAAAPSPEHNIFFSTMIATAIEPGVVAELEWADLNFDASADHKFGVIHARGTKTDYRDRFVPMTSKLRHLLMAYWMEKGRPKKGYVFASGDGHTERHAFETAHRRMWGKDLNEVKPSKKRHAAAKDEKVYLPIKYFRLYDLRHTALTRMGESGMTEIELMKIAGWSSTRMAATYVHPSQKRIGKAMERFEQYMNAEAAVAGD